MMQMAKQPLHNISIAPASTRERSGLRGHLTGRGMLVQTQNPGTTAQVARPSPGAPPSHQSGIDY